MITDAFMDFLQAIAEVLLDWIPSDILPDTASWSSAAQAIADSSAGWVAHFIPIGELAAAAAVVLAAHGAAFGARTIIWLATKSHILGGK